MPDSNSEFQNRIIELVSQALKEDGFALGGGQAFKALGINSRLSLDADFYTPEFESDVFDQAEEKVTAVLTRAGYAVTLTHRDSWLRELTVTEPDTKNVMAVDLGQDYRRHPPTSIGRFAAVLDIDDLVAGKARALWERGAVRDYIDIASLLQRPDWSIERLVEQFRFSCPNIPISQFTSALANISRLDPEAFAEYGYTVFECVGIIQEVHIAVAHLQKQGNTSTQSLMHDSNLTFPPL